jgi:hypothetical protein
VIASSNKKQLIKIADLKNNKRPLPARAFQDIAASLALDFHALSRRLLFHDQMVRRRFVFLSNVDRLTRYTPLK